MPIVYTSTTVNGVANLPHTATVDITSPVAVGTAASSAIHPPGFVSGNAPHYHHRGHLIARALGGPGNDNRNLVTLTDGTNVAVMGEIERVAREINRVAGQTFRYYVEAKYDYPGSYPCVGNPYAPFPVPSSVLVRISHLDGTALYEHEFQNGVLCNH